MKTLTIWFPIKPAPKERPKFSKFGGVYTPKKTKEFEQTIKEYFETTPKSFKFEEDIPITVNLVFGLPIPKSTPKSRKQAMLEEIIRHTKKPDVDNLAKAVLDALNGVAWEDDSQIVRLTAEKVYSVDAPYIYLYMYEATK